MFVGTPGFLQIFLDNDEKAWELFVGTPGFLQIMIKGMGNICRHT